MYSNWTNDWRKRLQRDERYQAEMLRMAELEEQTYAEQNPDPDETDLPPGRSQLRDQ